MDSEAEIADYLIGGRGQRGFVIIVAACDYQRNARFIDQNGIGLVDDGGREGTLDLIGEIERQTVAQKVEADLVGRGVQYIAGIGGTALGRVHALLEMSDAEAEKAVEISHPDGVTTRQVVVRGHDGNARGLTGVPGDGWNSRQRLAFACLYFGDATTRQRERTAKLDIEHFLTEHE